MTRRAILLGLLGAALICGLTYFNDMVMRQTMLVGNNMPFSVYGGLVLFLLVGNPLLKRLSRKLPLSSSEIAVILMLTLAACVVPGSGFLRTFGATVMLPHHFEGTRPGWKEHDAINIAPKYMLADVTGNESVAVNGYVQGLGEPGNPISLFDIPWSAWSRTMMFWFPLVLVFWAGLIALAVVLHKQWAKHEHLPYPIATFARSLLPDDKGERPSIFGNRIFWAGFIVILLIHANNYAHEWFPHNLIPFRTAFNFTSLRPLFPTFSRGGGMAMLGYHCRFFFTVIGVAYFLASDVSFSFGIAPFAYCYVSGVLARYGFSMAGGGFLYHSPVKMQIFGANLGVFLVLFYTGRHYYCAVGKRALGLSANQEVEKTTVIAARLSIVFISVFVASLVIVGLELPIALFYTFGCVIFFVVMGRVIAETGLFFFQLFWFPGVVLAGLVGAKALGQEAMMIMFLLSMVFLLDPREALMPFVVNSFGLVDKFQIKLGRAAIWSFVAILVGMLVAVPVMMYFQYDRGANMADRWTTEMVPQFPFEEIVQVREKLISQGSLEIANSAKGLERLQHISPNKRSVTTFFVSLVVVILCSLCRLRFNKWPIHPVLFLVWHSYAGKMFAWSFLIGWLIKILVTKYGGASGYHKLKPLMVGVIAGDMLGSFIPFLIGLFYHLITGELPPVFTTMPH